jgi:hypothetical protein
VTPILEIIYGFLILCGVGFGVAWVLFPPATGMEMRAGADRILGIDQAHHDDPCPVCMVALDTHTAEQTKNCAEVYFR